MPKELPKPVEDFRSDYVEVSKALTELGDKCHNSGPLDEKTRRLLKLALCTGAGLEGGTHSAVRNALASGCSSEEIRHVAVLETSTIGLPAHDSRPHMDGDCVSSSS
ncbi:MAG TPA: carboxymuconolactone decarboxylase family protein [Pyrinomonadaceae bacterium]|nr:carboxymuconolactone decarboxylase family protein [Pyrinomonadaceae bacterium]